MKNVKMLLAGPGTSKTTKIKEIVKNKLKTQPDSKILVLSFTNATVNDLLSELSEIGINSKNCMTLHSFALQINHLKNEYILAPESEEKIIKEISELLNLDFVQVCKLLECITFKQMISECVKFIRINPQYSNEKIGNLDLLVVDEFQDFNIEERELISVISDKSNETIILGDDDQCIYGFKDADSEEIIKLFNDEKILKIEHENKCYRCPRDVVIAGNKLIKRNRNRVDKEWNVHNTHDGLEFFQTRNQSETNKLVIDKIKQIRTASSESSIMVLSNVSFASEPLIKALDAENIEVRNQWQTRMSLETMEKIWWLRTIFSRRKLLNLIFLLRKKGMRSKQKKEAVLEVLNNHFQSGVSNSETIKKLVKLGTINSNLLSNIEDTITVDTFLTEHPEFTEFSNLLNDESPQNTYDSLPSLLSEKEGFDKTKINLMSVYKSKGLQADHVIILGLVDGILPRSSQNIDDIEAERRLFFVGLSRAKIGLCLISQICWPSTIAFKVDKNKFKFNGKLEVRGQASPFISELTQ